jgi:hypothetical protein
MKLAFTKGTGKFDWLVITTDACPQPPIECLKQGIIPHDMVHFAVESQVAACDFLGGIAAGSGFTAGTDDPHAGANDMLAGVCRNFSAMTRHDAPITACWHQP